MKALLDTHSFLWWISKDSLLSPHAWDVISDGRNEIYLSAASAWEMAIKVQRGRLQLPDPLSRFVADQLIQNGFHGLPIELSHALHVYGLPEIHRDPFDRLLIAQAQLEDLPMITGDIEIAKYKVQIIW